MTDEAALLAAIIANRADDTPLLVYADWLQDNDREKEARRIRKAVVRFTADQWAMIEKVLAGLLFKEDGDTRISIGNFTYYLHRPLESAKRGIVAAFKEKLEQDRKDFVWRLVDPYLTNCHDEWQRVCKRALGEEYIFLPLGDVIRKKVCERMTLRSIGIRAAFDLSMLVDDIILNELTGSPNWQSVSPRSIPNLDARLKDAVLGFDPWSFDWSKCRIQPKIRRLMRVAGFTFSAPDEP